MKHESEYSGSGIRVADDRGFSLSQSGTTCLNVHLATHLRHDAVDLGSEAGGVAVFGGLLVGYTSTLSK